MKNILVPIDFSQNAKAAVNAAKVIARKTGAKLHLLHAYVPFVPIEVHVAVNWDIYSDAEAAAQGDLEALARELAGEGYSVEALWVDGPVLPAVVEAAYNLKVDLVVIGRTGQGGFLDKLFGSVASDIVRSIRGIPVLTIPPTAELTKIGKIVYATRLEYEESEVIEKIVTLSKDLSADLKLLKISSPLQPDIQPDHQFKEPLKERFGFTEEDFVVAEVGRDSLVKEIENMAIHMGADILAVLAREKGVVERLLVDPSISKRLLLRATIPLMICRRPE